MGRSAQVQDLESLRLDSNRSTVTPTTFSISAQELSSLVDPKSFEAFSKRIGSVQKLAEVLKTDLHCGLSKDEIESRERSAEFGANVLPEAKTKSLLQLMWTAIRDPTLVMLIIAAVISIILAETVGGHGSTGWVEGTAILIAVLLVVTVTSMNDYQKEKQFQKLNRKKNDKLLKVVRNGEDHQISIHDVKVGDVVRIETGDVIAVDGVLIEGFNIKCDESGATGESDAIKKNHTDDPFFISGSLVQEGYGRMLVIAVGVNSFNGRTLMSLRIEPSPTPLQEKLVHLAELIGKLGLAVAALTLTILVVKDLVLRGQHGGPWGVDVLPSIVRYIITAITIVVVAVPEGLPLAVTIALAYSMVQMLKDNNFVRRLEACETMGGATNICSDKTGTLTTNKMTVVRGVVGGRRFEDPHEIPPLKNAITPNVLSLLCDGICMNSTATELKNDKTGLVEFVGSKTETALLVFARKLGANYADTRETLKPKLVQVYPFTSAKKRMSCLLSTEQRNKYRLYTKGAAEIVLEQCTSIITESGEIRSLGPIEREQMKSIIQSMAADALRTICLAYADVEGGGDWTEPPENNLVCVGIVGIMDPLRDEVPQAVADCQRAGIMVRMVTGDNIITAKSIARKCGIFDPDQGLAIEGPEFRQLSPERLDEILPRLQVLARSSPLDKQMLVERLKFHGEIVAVTGDGTNDGPALKMAHVGFGMNIAGTEVAKEASAILLMDDNFASIVKAVLWGRNVMGSIQKFLQFQLTVNVVAVSLAFIGSISNGDGESPLKPVQLLWVNLIMDTMAALALATEAPTKDLLDQPPNSRKVSLINQNMRKMIIVESVFQLTVNLVLLYAGPMIFGFEKDSEYHYTFIFNTFVFMQIFNEINCRNVTKDLNVFRGLTKNYIFAGVLCFTIIVQCLLISFAGSFASTTPLRATEWVASVFIGATSLPLGVLARLLPDSKHRLMTGHKATSDVFDRPGTGAPIEAKAVVVTEK